MLSCVGQGCLFSWIVLHSQAESSPMRECEVYFSCTRPATLFSCLSADKVTPHKKQAYEGNGVSQGARDARHSQSVPPYSFREHKRLLMRQTRLTKIVDLTNVPCMPPILSVMFMFPLFTPLSMCKRKPNQHMEQGVSAKTRILP